MIANISVYRLSFSEILFENMKDLVRPWSGGYNLKLRNI